MIVEGLHALAEGELTKKVSLEGKDEFAWMCWEYNNTRKGFDKLVHGVLVNANTLAVSAEKLSAVAEKSKQGMIRQHTETEQVATGMHISKR